MQTPSCLVQLLLTLTILTTIVFATPVTRTAAYADIEKRWAEGMRDERELHSGLSHRDMTPAWSMHARDAEDDEDFASATWTRAKRTTSLMDRMQAFAERVMREKGVTLGARKREAVQVTDSQRPWKPQYYFSY
ncbi:hypothetical protein CLAFUW4_05733 [Fulvia fulva]|uniref:Uncharacterized protein n=1 Tax=Passalora fulva TaxID=5499 RepID=A0A9Q8P9J1_PASFU|nr:uncharacterized protein CLAFUR5_05876 [Fulvia fulva]KAK4624762.1 hypothetical protein CLAFUR4_05727 [Fulvia fulva]KAK4624926.1 hypothetical protein CLAFUR0_05738 [Fulvia fulva]UJO18314.1 hypothetical protein CLAFUR5_05876 [Fulvia fulva]WPV14948.1 hypothetical protein CLAFUW4_05733 [Fulvia fulva]WPV30502.1 hypothetical protein CLAFUW7_05731 [Fulvia fulva]